MPTAKITTLTMGKPPRHSAGVFLLAILISVSVFSQSGPTVYALQNSNASSKAAVLRANAGRDPSKAKPIRHLSSLRGLEDPAEEMTEEEIEATTEAVEEVAEEAVDQSTEPTTEEEIEAMEAVVEEVVEEVVEGTEEGEPLNVAVEEAEEGLEEAMEEVAEEETVEEVLDEAAEDEEGAFDEQGEEDTTATSATEMASVIAFEPGDFDEDASTYPEGYPIYNETYPEGYPFPEGVDVVEPTPPAMEGMTSEPPSPDDGSDGSWDETTAPSAAASGDFGEGDEPEGEFPQEGENAGDSYPTEAPTPAGGNEDNEGDSTTEAPTPASGNEDNEGDSYAFERTTEAPTPASGNEDKRPSYSPTKYDGGYNYWNSEVETGPTNAPTDKPTFEYIPKDENPDVEEEENTVVGNFADDDSVFYHGLGGKVGAYLDGVESPQEMEKDENVQIVAGTLLAVFLVLTLITAHKVMNVPDGLCAGFCRLLNKCICCLTRTLCLPCRAICCKGSDQSHGRRTHAPMRTPFPTDLELA